MYNKRRYIDVLCPLIQQFPEIWGLDQLRKLRSVCKTTNSCVSSFDRSMSFPVLGKSEFDMRVMVHRGYYSLSISLMDSFAFILHAVEDGADARMKFENALKRERVSLDDTMTSVFESLQTKVQEVAFKTPRDFAVFADDSGLWYVYIADNAKQELSYSPVEWHFLANKYYPSSMARRDATSSNGNRKRVIVLRDIVVHIHYSPELSSERGGTVVDTEEDAFALPYTETTVSAVFIVKHNSWSLRFYCETYVDSPEFLEFIMRHYEIPGTPVKCMIASLKEPPGECQSLMFDTMEDDEFFTASIVHQVSRSSVSPVHICDRVFKMPQGTYSGCAWD